MKKSLLKLIEYSILPAICIFAAKLAGIFVTGLIFNIPIDLRNQAQGLLFFQTLVPQADMIVVITYSDLFMYLVVVLGMTVILIRSVYFHDSHISSTMVSRLAKYNLLGLMQSSYELYHSGMIWLAFLWCANVLIGINVYRGLTETWALAVTVLFSLSYSIIFFKDLLAEIQLSNDGNLAKT